MAKVEFRKNILPEFDYYKINLINNIIDKKNILINSDTDSNSDSNSESSLGYDYFSNILKERKINNNKRNTMKDFFIK